MRISDWSSDVCSSDLTPAAGGLLAAQEHPQEHQDRCDPAACRKKMDKARSKPDRACHALTSGRVAVPCQRPECAARQRRRQREGGLHLPPAPTPPDPAQIGTPSCRGRECTSLSYSVLA